METADCSCLRIVRSVLISALILLAFNHSVFAEEIPERIDGVVVSSDEKNRLLIVDFEHPATLERSQLKFEVREKAGFKDFKKLSDLKKGDLVSLDYLKEGEILRAIYIIHIPQEKTYFTHKEVADALVKIKSNSKNGPEKN